MPADQDPDLTQTGRKSSQDENELSPVHGLVYEIQRGIVDWKIVDPHKIGLILAKMGLELRDGILRDQTLHLSGVWKIRLEIEPYIPDSETENETSEIPDTDETGQDNTM